ncbi:enoyl-CoA hydratase/isomerase family protein [Saccharopolyspora spinosa]|uniref:Enoyl-CoA hydratase/carnithine racemase n=1 Tax=Saccharopolyspora spinosa TaxID=60894 RepID=A0A2N3Y6L7_SACSN|nr:enoyl-CoA hydratase/isomerase family protein [Saccharopolyspora spinosa]PKW18576.1 enoyl-CoA hydratase/carnithine racemase [Saccharopolyspora spinosa]
MSINRPEWQTIAVTARDGITELRVHTGGGPLVWSATAHRELTEAFAWVGADHGTKVVLITGTGDRYCTELDVTSFTGVGWDRIWWEGRRMLKNLDDIEVPVISAVHGPVTIHSEIPVMADIVLASTTAEFADRAHFASRDTVPGDGVNLVWGELLGPTRAKYWLLTGATIGAEEGRRIGFVNEVLAADELLPRAWELARELAARELAVLRYAKAAASIGFRRNFGEGLSHGLGVEGCAHWHLGGLKAGQVSHEKEAGT